jgi:hypothetical protein
MRGPIVVPPVWRINDIELSPTNINYKFIFFNIDFHAQHNHESSLRAWKSQAFDDSDSASDFGLARIVRDEWSTWM